jgi:large subunit ribosomal protein L3
MPGHFGVETVTISGLEIVSIDSENNEVLIKGCLPGSINSWVVLKKLS